MKKMNLIPWLSWINLRTACDEDKDKMILKVREIRNLGADAFYLDDLFLYSNDKDSELHLFKALAAGIDVPFYVGGGVNSFEDVKKIFYAGAEKVVIETSAPDAAGLMAESINRFGEHAVLLSLNNYEVLANRISDIAERGIELIIRNTDINREHKEEIINCGAPIYLPVDDEENYERVLAERNENLKGIISKSFVKEIPYQEITPTFPFNELKTNADGLIPVIVQDYQTNEVLMMAYMDEEAYEATLRKRIMAYHSRSRGKLWIKGETSGHYQYLRSLWVDCDKDTLLAKVFQIGEACHTGNRSCFYTLAEGDSSNPENPLTVFSDVFSVIHDRRLHPKEGSYTNYLFNQGLDKILKKFGEEATEAIIAAKNSEPEEVKYEIADLLYHMMVLMEEKNISWEDITRELAQR